jgi:hypothetical protein
MGQIMTAMRRLALISRRITYRLGGKCGQGVLELRLHVKLLPVDRPELADYCRSDRRISSSANDRLEVLTAPTPTASSPLNVIL